MKLASYFLFFLIFLGCSAKKEPTTKELAKINEKSKLISQRAYNDSIWNDKIEKLKSKYNIESEFKDLNYKYTIEFDKKFLNQYQILRNFKIEDIIQINSIPYVQGHVWLSYNSISSILFTLSVSEKDLKLFLDKSKLKDLVIIVKLESIKKRILEISGYPEYEEECTLQIDFPALSIFIGKGEIIDLLIKN